MGTLTCNDWDSFDPQPLTDNEGNSFGVLMPRATAAQLGLGIQGWSRPATETRTRKPAKLGRKGSLIDPKNYVNEDRWYRVGNRIAWWDRYTKHWIAYYVEPGTPYQRGPCDMYPNAEALLVCEETTPTEWPTS